MSEGRSKPQISQLTQMRQFSVLGWRLLLRGGGDADVSFGRREGFGFAVRRCVS
jgi:hypothetical protein